MTLVTKKCPLWPYLALYAQFSQCALLLKAMPTNYRICHNFNCYIKESEAPKTCSVTNHKGSISHHITPLVINSLGGGHTHTSVQTSQTKQFQEIIHAPAFGRHTWFKNNLFLTYKQTYTYMYTHNPLHYINDSCYYK